MRAHALMSSVIGRPVLLMLLTVVIVAGGCMPPAAEAQRSDPRVHPERVDPTWGGRMTSAWHLAWAQRWREAEASFSALRSEQPDAMEPLVGLAFVARAQTHYGEARQYYAEALARDSTSADVHRQALATTWERSGWFDVRMGRTFFPGTGGAPLVSGHLAATLSPQLVVLGRAASFAGGAPFDVGGGGPARSIGCSSAGEGPPAASMAPMNTRASVYEVGAAMHPSASVWLTPRLERWSAASGEDVLGWVDGAYKPGDNFTVLGGVRPLDGRLGAPQVSAGAEIAVNRAGDVLTVYGAHGLRATCVESRDFFRAFFTGAPVRRMRYQLMLAEERGPPFSAMVVAASATFLTSPTRGLRADVSRRTGAFAQTTISSGVVMRW